MIVSYRTYDVYKLSYVRTYNFLLWPLRCTAQEGLICEHEVRAVPFAPIYVLEGISGVISGVISGY